jgi:signal transduction histidine kinase
VFNTLQKPLSASEPPDAALPLPAVPQQVPLPAALAGTGHGWINGYRRYAVFSPPWVRARARRVGLLGTALLLLLLGSSWLSAGPLLPLGGFVQLAITVLLPLFIGPWAGSLARQQALARGASDRAEALAVAAALALVVAATSAFNHWAAEPMKQQLAEWTGMVDAEGQRKRVTLSVGIFIRNEDAPEHMARGASDTSDASDTSPHGTGLTPGAHLLFALTGAILAGALALPRLKRERDGLRHLAAQAELARAQQQRREAELRLSVLAAQVEPHFLFNTLAGVRSAITTDPPRAAALVDHLVDYLRAAIPRLRADGGADATLAGQVEIVRAYLALMAARMPRLQVSIDVPDELLALPCPPLMLVSLAENAVKHGAEPKPGVVHIRLVARLADDGRLLVQIEDDGAGFGVSAGGTGIGLANLRGRLEALFGSRAALVLRERPGGGVIASLLLPVDDPGTPPAP